MAQFETRLRKLEQYRSHHEGLGCTARAAERLRHWETGSRDDAVHEAAAAGLILVRTQRITGRGRTTIMRILNDRPDRACSPS